MAVVRLEALKMLALYIKTAIPELVDHICLGQADPRKEQSLPTLTIEPIRWKYFPDQMSEHNVEFIDRLIANVGRHESTIQLRLKAATAFQRSYLEQRVIDLFLETPLHPGVLQTVVVACDDLGDFLAAWEYDTDEWDDIGAFDGEFCSVIAVTGIIPALVTRGSVHSIEELQLGLTHEFETEFTPTTFNTSVDVEVVQVNQDGSIEAV